MVKILAALSILNSSGANPGATEKVAALVARATCSSASHSSVYCICMFAICFVNYNIVKSITIECIATINVNIFALEIA